MPFRDPGKLLWHIYHSHGLNVEPVGKPKHPRFWEEILYTGKNQAWRLGWDEKIQLVDEILTKSVNWKYIHTLGNPLSLSNLRRSLQLRIRGNELGLTIKLKLLILKIYLEICKM